MPEAALRLTDPPAAASERPALAALPGAGTGPPAPPRIELPPYDFAAALALERELGVSHAFAQVLTRRGLSDAAGARAFLDAADEHDPQGFAGIGEAIAVIRRHIAAGSRIVVHGDYDVDGVCATAILVRALRSLGADAGWFLPSRIDDGYGLAAATVSTLAGRGVGLLITVDCAITAVEEVAAARGAGLDVVVTDHHAPRLDGALPDAPLVHPAVCGYPCPELCGTGVAYKLARALGAPSVQGDGELELVALATVADLMPLTGENRRLVRSGLRALACTTRPGLRALMSVARVDPSGIDAGALGFRLAPRINAAGRLRRADAALELLLTEDAERAREIAVELDGVNAERRAVEERITWEAERLVAELGERPAYVLAAEGWHPGVIGIVASRITERHHRPAVLIALEHGEPTGSGSGRSIPGFDLLAGLHAAGDLLERYGGHRAAAGLTIDRTRIPEFAAAFEAHAASVLTPDLLVRSERVDAVVSGSQLDLSMAEELAALEPCGIGNPAPRLLVPGARFTDVRPMGESGRHARFTIRSGAGHARAVAFGCDGRPSAGPEIAVDATLRLERNVWNGAVEPRSVLRHAVPCAEGEIEILGEPADYLGAVFEELSTDLSRDPALAACRGELLDRRGESPLAVLADAIAAGDPVLAVCADVDRRIAGLRQRCGGFSLISSAALVADPSSAARFGHVVALDPPASPAAAAALRGARYTHLAWGEAELRFAVQMHELEYALRDGAADLYRAIRACVSAAGEQLEQLLRGPGRHGRPPRVAGRLVRVLAELGLISADRALPELAFVGAAPTALERSEAYRIYTQRLEEGRRFLSSGTPGPTRR